MLSPALRKGHHYEIFAVKLDISGLKRDFDMRAGAVYGRGELSSHAPDGLFSPYSAQRRAVQHVAGIAAATSSRRQECQYMR